MAAQAPLSWTGRYAAERGWSGMDWGVGLPGTIGGATVNNAGAHGTEQIDHLEAVIILNERGEIEERPAAWLEAAYRHTIIKAAPRPRPWTVLAAIMLLPKGDPAALVRLADEHAAFRKETQPTGACAGSTFANPPGDFAGRLLEESGLKGFAIGGAAFSPKHANWIVNDGTATAADVRALIATAQARVRDRFGVELRREVEYLRREAQSCAGERRMTRGRTGPCMSGAAAKCGWPCCSADSPASMMCRSARRKRSWARSTPIATRSSPSASPARAAG